jgi:integral membrane sensor domain MASE1
MLKRSQKLALANILLAVVYFLMGKFGLRLASVHPSATAVWPPSGIALASFLLLGYEVWPGILVGAFLTNVINSDLEAFPCISDIVDH